MSEDTVAIHYVRAAIRGLERHGKNADRLLAQFNITNEQLSCTSNRVPNTVFVALIRYSWKELSDENIGLGKKGLPNGAFFYASQLAVKAENLGAGLDLMLGFYNYLEHGYKINISRLNDCIEVEFVLDDPEIDAEHMLADLIMAAFHRFCSWLIGKEMILKQIKLNFPPPAHAAEYARLYSCPKTFDSSKLCFRFNYKYLDLPIVKNSRELDDYVASMPMNILLKPVDDDSYTARVKGIISVNSDNNFPSFAQVAKQLHMVERTLREKLKSEGITYQKIKDVRRRDLAIYCLYQPNYSIADIAEKIGFTETGAFIRAFKGWTNITPGMYRNQFIDKIGSSSPINC